MGRPNQSEDDSGGLEYASLKENDTFASVMESKANSAPIGCKWVYKTKRNPNDTLRYKARLVIKGYGQVKGVNFDETYAPVGSMTTCSERVEIRPFGRRHRLSQSEDQRGSLHAATQQNRVAQADAVYRTY